MTLAYDGIIVFNTFRNGGADTCFKKQAGKDIGPLRRVSL